MTVPYRPTNFRKQDHRDFSGRVKRIDPAFNRRGHGACTNDDTKPHVVVAALIGFGWASLVAAIGTNRDQIETSLRQGSLSSDAQYWIVSALAAALAASLVMIAAHLVRAAVTRGARRRNSRALLLGAGLALGMFYTPDLVWQTGFNLFDGAPRDFLAAAGDMVVDTFPGLNIDQISFTASRGY